MRRTLNQIVLNVFCEIADYVSIYNAPKFNKLSLIFTY